MHGPELMPRGMNLKRDALLGGVASAKLQSCVHLLFGFGCALCGDKGEGTSKPKRNLE